MANTRLSATIPASTATCTVSIINATCDLRPNAQVMVEPVIPGMEHLDFPTYSFHIKHNPSGRQFLFDMGARKDWKNNVPQLVQILEEAIGGLDVKKEVPTILADSGVRVEEIEAMILSHWHFDHTGNLARLSTATKLVVGPGFRDEFLPGYPANPKSFFWEEEFDGREVVEISFSGDLMIGQFQAHDYLGDGSLYILNVPGHATGHISALVRTTPDTFVFLGGDVCHHAGVFRPTQYLPLPSEVPKGTAALDKLTPFFRIPTATPVYSDPAQAQDSVESLQAFDADPNILVVIAHDPTSAHVFDFFPNGTLSDWKQKGWKEKGHWGFLGTLPFQGKAQQASLGTMKVDSISWEQLHGRSS
ncbi:uncharacterized protein AB675_3711 [Cyphellophora attinorum]|uniref:Metallo-beta-lactamase domain-containing protein n=1 Tax=Cyphellophora attinorum TaxID=1664694 RepID=A0A0N1H098_9EURO|nr:uncharacterized protein AB675_3711 [Phialophora attinorum]KPI37070.1 hypothetical protein AB675_3711 [Phialophora attinorum]